MSLCNDAMTAAKDVQDIKTGTVTVGASQTTGVYIMPYLIGESHAAVLSYPSRIMAMKCLLGTMLK